jgi:hypothetical protein
MSNSPQNSLITVSQAGRTIETLSTKFVTFVRLMKQAKIALQLPASDLPFGQAMSWLIKAEEVALEIGDYELLTVSGAYIDLILVASTKSQQLALNCGHILRQHRELVIAVESALGRLAHCRRQHAHATSTLPCTVLEAQGHAEQLVQMVTRHLDEASTPTNAELLNRFLSNLNDVRNLIFPLTPKLASDFRSDRETLNLIGIAVLGASYSTNRFFNFLSDYEKAATFCRWSEIILRDVDNREAFVLGQVDRADLSNALRRAQVSLSASSFSMSKFYLDTAKKILKTLDAKI